MELGYTLVVECLHRMNMALGSVQESQELRDGSYLFSVGSEFVSCLHRTLYLILSGKHYDLHITDIIMA